MHQQTSITSKAWFRNYVGEVCQTLMLIYSFYNYLFSSYNMRYEFTRLLVIQRITDLKNYTESNLCHLFDSHDPFKYRQKKNELMSVSAEVEIPRVE